MANSLSGLVGLTVGLPCSQVGTLFASVALVRIPNSYPGGFSATERRNHPSIPFAAGAAFRRQGPSLSRRLSARQRLGHTPPGPAPAASGRSGTARSRDQASVAPVGTRPVSENCQSAMSSLRACHGPEFCLRPRARTARTNTIMTRPSTGSATSSSACFCRLKDWRRIATPLRPQH